MSVGSGDSSRESSPRCEQMPSRFVTNDKDTDGVTVFYPTADEFKAYWRATTVHEPIYGADTPGSMYEDEQEVWNVTKLPSILDMVTKGKVGSQMVLRIRAVCR
ncbi:unnamed protein product [Sphagnum balticum]